MEMSIWKEFQNHGVDVLGISSQVESVIERFIEDQGITFPVLRDKDGRVYKDYSLPGGQSPYPRDFVIDREGFVRFASTEYDPGAMIALIESLRVATTANSQGGEVRLPLTFSIGTVFPNPFNSRSTILVHTGLSQTVELDVYDLAGRWIQSLYSGWLTAGSHRFTWSPSETGSGNLTSGIYIVSLKMTSARITRKIVLLK